MIYSILSLSFIYLLNLELISGAFTGAPKHIVYALLDDIGWSDIGVTGGQFPTPFMDSLYNNGIVLDRHYIHYLCSPSRAQFLTGRRCFNMGYGKMQPWGYTQIGAVPVGQPTIANWFRDFVAANPDKDIPKYETYGVGKWHIGYASEFNTPEYKGFDHYYGFYQSGINYFDKTHFKGDYWGTHPNQFDFFEDEVPAYPALNVTTNTMDLYLTKIDEYLAHFNQRQSNTPDETLNMYLYLGVQTLHGPLSTIRQYSSQCTDLLNKAQADFGIPWSQSRRKVCEYTLMTDDWMEYLVTSLQNAGLWDDTLLIFTGDNGADIDVAACNYPLRGTKSTMFEGNIRQITFVTGGDNIIPASQRGTVRDSLLSNLDWTPTLLKYAGVLDFIDPADYEWDGLDQLDIILDGDTTNERSALLLNVQSPSIATINDVTSASLIYKYEWTTPRGVTKGDGKYYKYVIADLNDADFNWIRQRNDGWCNINFTANNSIYVEDVDTSMYSTSALIKDSQFLFDLTDDEGEKYNLIRLEKIDGTRLRAKKMKSMTRFAKNVLMDELSLDTTLNDNNMRFYHEPIDCFWTMLEAGDPANFNYMTPVEGFYIMPFLGTTAYLNRLSNCFANVSTIPPALSDLYLTEWTSPMSVMMDEEGYKIVDKSILSGNRVQVVDVKDGYTMKGELKRTGWDNTYIQVFGVIAFVLVALFCSIVYQKRDNWKKGEYQPLLNERVDTKI